MEQTDGQTDRWITALFNAYPLHCLTPPPTISTDKINRSVWTITGYLTSQCF